MDVAEVSDHVLVDDPREEEDLLLRVWCLRPQHRLSILLVAEKHETFHLAHILHNLILLHQVSPHSLLNHVSPGHVAPHGSLKHHSVALNILEYLTEPSHAEVRLDSRSHLVNKVDPATHD